jgi:hypothetical protein
MKKLSRLLMILVLLGTAGLCRAEQVPFRDDYEGINSAAGSVLMLLVFDQEEEAYVSTGSGFVAFDSSTLITNYHVVEGGDLVLAESDDGRSYFLDQVIAADKNKDLAILRFKSKTSLTPLTLEGEGGWLRGQPVVAIGSPEGFKNTVSKGDISALFTESGVRYIQFTAPVSHGSSGGALFNNQGRVIGITSSSIMGDSQNLNFAIDIREAISLYQQAGEGGISPLSGLDSHSARQEPSQNETLPQDPSDISDLKARQTKPDTVTLSWQSSQPEDTLYFIGYEVSGNSYYSYMDTIGNTVEIQDLVPGQLYNFFISYSLSGLDRPLETISLKLEEPKPYTEREAEVLDFGVHYIHKDELLDVPLPQGIQTITASQLERALNDRTLSVIYRIRLEETANASTGNCLYVLTTPDSFVYTGEYYYNYEPSRAAYIRQVDLRDTLSFILKFEEQFTPGTWTAAAYHDGALLGQTTLEVTPDAAGQETQEPSGHMTASYPLRLGNEAYLGDHFTPYIDPDIINQSRDLAVTGLTLAYYAEDSDYKTLHFDDTGRKITYFSFDSQVLPGQTINPGRVSLEKYGETLGYIYVAIAEIRLEDGSVIRIPEDALKFTFWILD